MTFALIIYFFYFLLNYKSPFNLPVDFLKSGKRSFVKFLSQFFTCSFCFGFNFSLIYILYIHYCTFDNIDLLIAPINAVLVMFLDLLFRFLTK